MDAPPEKTNRLTDDQLDQIVRRLVAALSPLQVYLFGSHVYGNPSLNSDVDILAIVGDDGPDRFELSKRGYAALRGIHIPVELHLCKANTFDKFSSVVGSIYRDVKTKGRVVYAA